MLDRVIGIGIAAHEGQLFGIGNQLLGLVHRAGLDHDVRFRGGDVVAAPTRGRARRARPRVEGFTIRAPLMALIVCLAILLPMLGASLLVLLGTTRLAARAGA